MVKIDHNDVPCVDCLAQYLTSHFKVAGMPFDRPLGPMFSMRKLGYGPMFLRIRVVGRIDFVGVLRSVVNGGDIRLSELLTI